MGTSSRILFDASHKDDVGLVREVLLRRLRAEGDRWKTFGALDAEFERYVEFPSVGDRHRFDDLLREVVWELITLGMIAPGNGLHPSGANLPLFSITEFGREVLAAGRVIPHDPDGYLAEVGAAGKTCFDTVALGCVEEALRCFARGFYTASVLLLGVAAEAVVLKSCELLASSGALRHSYSKVPDNAKQKHRWLVDQYESLPPKARRESLPDGLDVTLTSAYDLIRRQRNELGHPTVPPKIDRQHAFTIFQVFLTIVSDMEAFVSYFAGP